MPRLRDNLRKTNCASGPSRRPMDFCRCARTPSSRGDVNDDVGIQHRDNPLEITGAQSRQECRDDFALLSEFRLGERFAWFRTLHSTARPAGELAGRVFRASDDWSDFFEWDG